MNTVDDSTSLLEGEQTERFVPPEEKWPEAYREIDEQATSETQAADIFRRHGVSDDDADLLARLVFAYDQDRLKALPPKAANS